MDLIINHCSSLSCKRLWHKLKHVPWRKLEPLGVGPEAPSDS